MSEDSKTIDKDRLEKYLSEKYSQDEGRQCRVIINYFRCLGKNENGDEKISFEGVIRRHE